MIDDTVNCELRAGRNGKRNADQTSAGEQRERPRATRRGREVHSLIAGRAINDSKDGIGRDAVSVECRLIEPRLDVSRRNGPPVGWLMAGAATAAIRTQALEEWTGGIDLAACISREGFHRAAWV